MPQCSEPVRLLGNNPRIYTKKSMYLECMLFLHKY